MNADPTTVLVLAGGPDAEREVSLASAAAVVDALDRSGRYTPHLEIIDRPLLAELSSMPGEVVFPVLHGCYGEGGPLQDLLEADGRPFVGSGPTASRLAMDKLATKQIAAQAGIPIAPSALLDPLDAVCPLELPVVVKPVREGSSVGLFVCKTTDSWIEAHAEASADSLANPGRAYMIEPFIAGRELTVAVLGPQGGLEPLPIVEIAPAQGVYDYDAKYQRSDTNYTPNPDLPEAMERHITDWAVVVAARIGVRHLARVDFMLGAAGPVLLEVNTMPGFTATSLYPKAAAAAGMDFADLCARLIELACASTTLKDSSA